MRDCTPICGRSIFASPTDARGLANQAAYRPELLIILDGVAIGLDSSFAAHVRLTFIRHGALGFCSPALRGRRGKNGRMQPSTTRVEVWATEVDKGVTLFECIIQIK